MMRMVVLVLGTDAFGRRTKILAGRSTMRTAQSPLGHVTADTTAEEIAVLTGIVTVIFEVDESVILEVVVGNPHLSGASPPRTDRKIPGLNDRMDRNIRRASTIPRECAVILPPIHRPKTAEATVSVIKLMMIMLLYVLF
jgi:hypothetical protein